MGAGAVHQNAEREAAELLKRLGAGFNNLVQQQQAQLAAPKVDVPGIPVQPGFPLAGSMPFAGAASAPAARPPSFSLGAGPALGSLPFANAGPLVTPAASLPGSMLIGASTGSAARPRVPLAGSSAPDFQKQHVGSMLAAATAGSAAAQRA